MPYGSHKPSLTPPTSHLSIGDKVWLNARNLNTTHPTTNLAPKCHGPFVVMAAISHVAYQLKLPLMWKIHNIFHGSLLTPYKETLINGEQYQEPTPDLIDGQPEWEVECVLGTRKQCHQLQYLIRWKGFSKAHDSWEPLTHLNANTLIQEFYQRNPSAVKTVTYKLTTPTLFPSIWRIIMSTPPLLSSQPPSPPLSDCINSRPPPIPLLDCLDKAGERFMTPPPRVNWPRQPHATLRWHC